MLHSCVFSFGIMNDHLVGEGGVVTCGLVAIVVRFPMSIPTNMSSFWLHVGRLISRGGFCHLPGEPDWALIPRTRYMQINRTDADNFIIAGEKNQSSRRTIVI